VNRNTMVGVQIVAGIAFGVVGAFLLLRSGGGDNHLLCEQVPGCTLQVRNPAGDTTTWTFTREGFVDAKIDDTGESPSLELYFRADGAPPEAEPTRVAFADALTEETALDLREQITAWRADGSDRPRPLELRHQARTGTTFIGYTLVGLGVASIVAALVLDINGRRTEFAPSSADLEPDLPESGISDPAGGAESAAPGAATSPVP